MNKIDILKNKLQKIFNKNTETIYFDIIDYETAEYLYNKGYKFINYQEFKEVLPRLIQDIKAMLWIASSEHEIFSNISYDPFCDEIDNLQDTPYDAFFKINNIIYGFKVNDETLDILEIIEEQITITRKTFKILESNCNN